MKQLKEVKIKKRTKIMNKITPYLFISPWIIGFLIFTLVPLIFSLIMSFYNWPVIGKPKFIGLSNYKHMFIVDPQFLKSLILTLKFALIFVPLNLIIALFLAVLITRPLKGIKAFRTYTSTYYSNAVI